MFSNVRLFIKTAFIFFVVGLLSGLYLYAAKLFLWPSPYTLASAHAHLLLMGGVYMMILGVAVWFFPRAKKEDPKYKPTWIYSYYWLFTLSTSGRFVFEVVFGLGANPAWSIAGFICTTLQTVAAIGLVYSIWGRIRPVGSQIREAKGERF
ncbi:MAG: hypothetical protein K9N35_10905 [Candidatus Marinimicrobia bacterium]|nr:hypothetical protein [Candidatus Neomarinimicrobiota bacterium]